MRRIVAAVCAVGVLLVACSADDDAAGDRATPPTTAPAAADATTTTAPAANAGGDLRVVAINQLHGLFCPEDSDYCNAPARLDLLFRAIEDAECPDIVGLAEIGPRQQELVPGRLAQLCGGAYELLWDPDAQGEPLDQEMILTSVPVLDEGYVELSNLPWSGHWVQADTAIGVVDMVMLHQASSSLNPPCDATNCAPYCEAGVETGTCHSREVLAFLEEHAAPGSIQLVTGDLNQPTEHPRIGVYWDAGFEDSWTEAGNAECDPATGAGCTCCIGSEREPWDGGGLTDASLTRSSRIDFVLVRSTGDCDVQYDAPTDRDGDGLGTGIFAAEPAAAPVAGVLWPSDHTGVAADLSCA